MINKLRGLIKIRATRRTKTFAISVAALAFFFIFKGVALWTNHTTFIFPDVLTYTPTKYGFALIANFPIAWAQEEVNSPIVVEKVVNTKSCEWSKECVDAYIDEIAGENKLFASWGKFAANNEGGYADQFSQANYSDVHENGKIGSFGQFQFGEDTYKANCETSRNWKMDWKAQARCAKKLFEQGSYKSHWFNTTNAWLQKIGQ